MGAWWFEDIAHGKTAGDAFVAAVEEARWENGHGGYTGTIAEKNGLLEFDLPARVTAAKVVAALREAMTPGEMEWWASQGGTPVGVDMRAAAKHTRWLVDKFGERTATSMLEAANDKWAPAVAFRVTGRALEEYRRRTPVPRGQGVWVFVGYASS